ncbi:MAG: hypothetical protein JWO93_2006 [Micrococcaceae bacterium]|nr:hypothetical protein [Micrococcaceae bacterium]
MSRIAVRHSEPVTTPSALGRTRRLAPGIIASALAVVLALALHALMPFLPAMTAAVVLGILAANLPGAATAVEGRLRAGLLFCGKHLMRAGIVLLGLKLSLADVVALGWRSAGLVVAVVVVSFAGTYLLGRAFRLPGDSPLLIATGFSICGASAIGAMAAVRGTRQQDTVLPIALVTLCGTTAIGVLPLLLHPLHLSAEEFGSWVGASVHDVGQVVATAQTAGAVALSAAVVVKLTRVLLLAPLVAVAGLVERRRTPQGSDATGTDVRATPGRLPPVVPLFVLGFLAMMLLRTTGWLPQAVLATGDLMQELLLGAALFGLGSAVRIGRLLHTGARSMLMALCAWLLIAVLGYGAVLLMH